MRTSLRHVFASQRPAIDFVLDPGDEAGGEDHSFQEEEQTMDTAEGEDCGRPREEVVKRTRTIYSKRRTNFEERE
jgi:hypothetical protein